MITFEAEVKKVVVKKTISNDKEIELTIVTTEETAIELQDSITNYPINVKIEKA